MESGTTKSLLKVERSSSCGSTHASECLDTFYRRLLSPLSPTFILLHHHTHFSSPHTEEVLFLSKAVHVIAVNDKQLPQVDLSLTHKNKQYQKQQETEPVLSGVWFEYEERAGSSMTLGNDGSFLPSTGGQISVKSPTLANPINRIFKKLLHGRVASRNVQSLPARSSVTAAMKRSRFLSDAHKG